jgi:hypothetical protein
MTEASIAVIVDTLELELGSDVATNSSTPLATIVAEALDATSRTKSRSKDIAL